ncbi:hypothetical protein A2U01_0093186, partial [Trifolium medium]|nr:hypothetical protein [Trifolium medium]
RGRDDEVGLSFPPMLDEGTLRPADGILLNQGEEYVPRGAGRFGKASSQGE